MMSLLMRRLFRQVFSRIYEHTWAFIAAVIVVLYCVGLVGMLAFGERDIVDNYTWWFSVTITTVGYGDYAPASTEARFLAGIIMFFGIGILGLVIGKVSELIIQMANRKMKGLGAMSGEQHTVIMGYREGSTEKVIAELKANNPDEKIVLCSYDTESNPLTNNGVAFVRGELASADVLGRANAGRAKNVIIHGSDDNQTFITAFALREVNTAAHLVCYLKNEAHAEKIRNLPADEPSLNQVILPANVYLMAQELQDRESSEVVQQLISNLSGDNLYRFDLPEGEDFSCPFMDIFLAMKLRYEATVIAIKDGEVKLNPGRDFEIREGMSIFYSAAERLRNIDLDSLKGASA